MGPADEMLAEDPTPLDPPPRWTTEEYDPDRGDPEEPPCWDDEDPPDLDDEEG